jgi:hypothetical protein
MTSKLRRWINLAGTVDMVFLRFAAVASVRAGKAAFRKAAPAGFMRRPTRAALVFPCAVPGPSGDIRRIEDGN